MAELIRPEVKFTTIHGENHRVGVTTEWGVMLDRRPAEYYTDHAAVLILGFANSLDSVLRREEFYGTVLQGYDEAVLAGKSEVVPEIGEARTGTNIGGRLNTLTSPLSSPFRTNIIQLPLGIQKRLLICRDPADEDKVERIIKRSTLSNNPNVNTRFQVKLFDSYKQRKEFLLRKPGGVIKKPKVS